MVTWVVMVVMGISGDCPFVDHQVPPPFEHLERGALRSKESCRRLGSAYGFFSCTPDPDRACVRAVQCMPGPQGQ